jgi:nicotinate-nucleotide adenylyltransferase
VSSSGPHIGIFGGTFDPIHTARLELAEAVRVVLDLDRMLLVVANRPWQKEGERSVTPAEDRFAMVEAAVEGWPGLVPSRIEIDRGGPSYTIDTVRQLLAEEPGAEVTVVVGSDVVPGLATWRQAADLSHLVTLAVVGRPGAPPVNPPPGWRAVNVAAAPFDVSSTELRRRLQGRQSVAGLVPEAVIRCICQRGLYATGR